MIIQLKQTFESIKQHYVLLSLASIIEILFFYSLTRLHIEIFKKAATHIKESQKIIQSQMDKLTQTQYAQMDKFLLGNSDFALQYHEILKYIGLFLLGLFLIWFLLRGTNWILAHKISNSKITLKEFIKRFALFSMMGFFLLIIILLAYTNMLSYVAFSPLPLINSKTANILFGLMLILLEYFLVSALAMPKNSRFRDIKNSILNAKKLAPAFTINLVILVALFIIPALLMRTNKWLGLGIALIITTPIITITRVLIIKSEKNN